MTQHNKRQPETAAPPAHGLDGGGKSELEQYGITAHPHIRYEWNGYRYSNASDAIAAAKRGARESS